MFRQRLKRLGRLQQLGHFGPALLFMIVACPLVAREQITSPDSRLAVTFALKEVDGASGCPVYQVEAEGRPLIAPSGLGFLLADGTDLTRDFQFVSAERRAHDSTWEPIYSERSRVRNHYRELTVHLRQASAPYDLLTLTFRCFNTGVAWRYTLTPNTQKRDITITQEKTEFRFTDDHVAWTANRAQAKYRKVRLSQLGQDEERPLTLRARDDLYVAIAEAALVDFARMKLARVRSAAHTLVSRLGSEVRAS